MTTKHTARRAARPVLIATIAITAAHLTGCGESNESTEVVPAATAQDSARAAVDRPEAPAATPGPEARRAHAVGHDLGVVLLVDPLARRVVG